MIVSQSYTFNHRPSYPLYITAKRYWDPQCPAREDPSAITLIFAHDTGCHKELWDPVVDDLYNADLGGLKIREMWSIDAPNHGDAFAANERILKEEYRPRSMWAEYGRTIHALLTGFGHGIDIDFSKHRLIGIGNCMGAVALLLSLDYVPVINFESLILCEIATMHNRTLVKTSGTLSEEVAHRRDIWSSREEAYKDLKSQLPWKVWDHRVLRTYVQDGLQSLPTPHYPEKEGGVTLKCPRVQEMACYADLEGLRQVYASLGTMSQQLPVHMIYGAIKDYPIKRTADDEVENVFVGLDNVASFSRVEESGHHVAQVNPRRLAQKLLEVLANNKA